MALLLQSKGITRIRPLAGGIDAWLAHKFPVAVPEPLGSPPPRPTDFILSLK